MSKLIQLEIKPLPAFRIIGKEIRVRMGGENPIPAFWSRCFADGTFSVLEAMGDSVFCGDYVGFMCDYQSADGCFTYLCGMMMKPGAGIPEGFGSRDVADSTVAVGWIQGPEKDNYPAAHTMTEQEMGKQGFVADGPAGWCMELYNCPRFTQPMENGDVILDYYIPCVKA